MPRVFGYEVSAIDITKVHLFQLFPTTTMPLDETVFQLCYNF